MCFWLLRPSRRRLFHDVLAMAEPGYLFVLRLSRTSTSAPVHGEQKTVRTSVADGHLQLCDGRSFRIHFYGGSLVCLFHYADEN